MKGAGGNNLLRPEIVPPRVHRATFVTKSQGIESPNRTAANAEASGTGLDSLEAGFKDDIPRREPRRVAQGGDDLCFQIFALGVVVIIILTFLPIIIFPAPEISNIPPIKIGPPQRIGKEINRDMLNSFELHMNSSVPTNRSIRVRSAPTALPTKRTGLPSALGVDAAVKAELRPLLRAAAASVVAPAAKDSGSLEWKGPFKDTYLGELASKQEHNDEAGAKAACEAMEGMCGGITKDPASGRWSLRQKRETLHSPSGELSWVFPERPPVMMGTEPSEEGLAFQIFVASETMLVWAETGESCDSACRKASGRHDCDPGWFRVINTCPIMFAAFPDATDCVERRYYGRDLPAQNLATGADYASILLNSRPDQYPGTCASVSLQARRLCPCVDGGRLLLGPGGDGGGASAAGSAGIRPNPLAVHVAIAAAIIGPLEERAAKEAADPALRQRSKLGEEKWAQAFPAAELLEDAKARRGGIFVRARLGESCIDACSNLGFGCSRRWFDALNNCNVLLSAFPEAARCRADVHGVDLPAFRPSTGDALVNARPEEYRGLCHSKDGNTKRLCGCGFPSTGPKSSRTFHTVYSVQATQYFEWQVRYMHLWFKQAGMPGRITRLLSANDADFLVESIPTHVAPANPIPIDSGYQPYNKPAAVMHWLEHSRPSEDIVMVIDPDCMFVSPFEMIVDEGAPLAQRAFYSFDDMNSVAMQIARRYCDKCTFVDPIAVPVIIHQHDLRKIAPLWLKKTAQIRADRGTWPPDWDNKTLSPIGLGWTAEMFGYVFAAAELGIRHEVMDLQNVPTVHTVINMHILHYHVDVPLPNGKRWYKHDDDAGYNIPWPVPEGTNEVSSTIVRKVWEAYNILGPANHTWKTPNKYTPEV